VHLHQQIVFLGFGYRQLDVAESPVFVEGAWVGISNGLHVCPLSCM